MGGYPGQEGDSGIFDALLGNVAPAGRLPVTQYPASSAEEVNQTHMALRPGPGNANLGRTHIWYEGDAVVPFGHGLHYTNFSLSWGPETPEASYTVEEINEGLTDENWAEHLLRKVLSLPLTVHNTGSVTFDYVALLFLESNAGPQPYPKKNLVAYARARDIAPDKIGPVQLDVDLERLTRVDEDGSRTLYPGDYTLYIDIDRKVSFNFTITGSPGVIESFPLE